MKIKPNQICPLCQSGKKFKNCCRNIPKNKIKMKSHQIVKKTFERKRAEELIRLQQQGLGKPIISAQMGEQQFVAVGGDLYSSKNWKTFSDFLFYYIKKTLGEKWGNSEIQKRYENRHPILQWYEEICAIQKKYLGRSGEVRSFPATCAIYCYCGLAYNLYLLKHNVELQQRYIERLKDINNFQGAYYELVVANCMIRAGFKLELEDEDDTDTKHCEFSAISLKTGKKYWVEAKMRSVVGILGKTKKNGTKKKDPTCMLSKHIKNAFKKPAEDERIIFVDVNTKPELDSKPSWIERAGKKMDMKEKDLESGKTAYVFVTNICFHWDLKGAHSDHAILAHGLGIPDFAKPGFFRLSEAYRKKQLHIDAYNIIETFKDYPKIPSTFDGSLPSETFSEDSQSVKIGETYFFNDIGENGFVAKVTSATVDVEKKIAYFGTDKGSILTKPMSDDELADYKNHPDTFFGIVYKQGKNAKDKYEFFENLVDIHLSYERENILKLIEKWDDAEELLKLDHFDLVIEYCERVVGQIYSQNVK